MSPSEFREWVANFLIQAAYWSAIFWLQPTWPWWAYILIAVALFFFFPIVPAMVKESNKERTPIDGNGSTDQPV